MSFVACKSNYCHHLFPRSIANSKKNEAILVVSSNPPSCFRKSKVVKCVFHPPYFPNRHLAPTCLQQQVLWFHVSVQDAQTRQMTQGTEQAIDQDFTAGLERDEGRGSTMGAMFNQKSGIESTEIEISPLVEKMLIG